MWKNKRIYHLVFSYKLCDFLSLQDFQPNSWFLGTSVLTVLVAALRCAMQMQSCKSREQLMDLYITHLLSFPKQNTIKTPLAVTEQPSAQHPAWLKSLCKALWAPHGASVCPITYSLYQEYLCRWWMGMWKLQKPFKLFYLYMKKEKWLNKNIGIRI